MNTVNKLMDILPEDPQDWTPEHIEEIIAWQRKMFLNWEKSGSSKRKAPKEDQAALIEEALKDLMETKLKVTPFKRRF